MQRRNLQCLLGGLLLAAAAPVAAADFITGTLLDANGQPVAGANINAKNLGSGGDPNLQNDGTDANGFFLTTIPAGTYRITFIPPAPPAALGMPLDVEPVVVLGTTDMGTIVLPPARALTGRALGPGGVPVAGINLDVIEKATGDNLDLTGDTTDALGNFSLAVPVGDIEVRFDTTPVAGQVLAPEHVSIAASQSSDLGDVPFEQGYLVTAIVRDPSGFPVVGADADAYDVVTGEKRYTPGDNTNGSGFVDFVVAAGTYDFTFCPMNGEPLACGIVRNFPVNANASLGIVTLPQGFHISGLVTDGIGTPIQNVNLDVKDEATLLDLPLEGDSTNGSGNYDIVVPAGTYTVTFSPPYSLPLAADVQTGVVVAGPTVLNSVLPPCSFFQTSGSGTPGTGGLVPQLTATGGTPRLGNADYTLELSNARGGALALIETSFAPFGGGGTGGSVGPFVQGLRVAGGGRVHAGVLSGTPGMAGQGSASVPFPIAGDPALIGLTLHAGAAVRDPQAAGGVALSPNLSALICP